jgi:hypothetical protein
METVMTQLDRALESTWALVLTRFGVPFMLTVIVALGSLAWSDIREGLELSRSVYVQQGKDGKDIAAHTDAIRDLRGDIRDLEQRLRAKGISDPPGGIVKFTPL